MKKKQTKKSPIRIICYYSVIIFMLFAYQLKAQEQKSFTLENELFKTEIFLTKGSILKETFSLKNSETELILDGNFQIDVQWSHWRFPGKKNNAENDVILDKNDFQLHNSKQENNTLTLYFKGPETLNLEIKYSLDKQKPLLRRQISVFDTVYGEHFLHKISGRFGRIDAEISYFKNNGGFGQPIAFEIENGSAFIGTEYPTAYNLTNTIHEKTSLNCYQFFGQQIKSEPIASATTIIGLFADKAIKKHFMDYVEAISITPARPYTLYNSWYDLRAADYPRPVAEENIMNEKNVFRIIDLINKNMIQKHNIQLDAFVLDDGWDIYESAWALRKEQFPNGMKPIADKLKETNTDLGIWFGPTGGYSARMKRIQWMKEQGYEAVDNEYRYNASYLCLAGKKYSELFKKRIVDFVENDGVRYFKWDGIQFSCSNPDHGHAVGVYSRRAVMESVIEKCETVRKNHTDVYLNITSGTWLSPWWVKYASQIWMDGGDYGWADLPSYNKRDAAITYRDFVLYDDFKQKNLWFPISHLMTHGIIKGNLQMLGGEEEPLDKFTDNALLYFARGVSMYELYISPTILNDAEWDAISQSLKWAKENFDILSSTFMVGGNPTKGEPYGYVHFDKDEGIIAVRNPYVDKNSINVALDANYGLDKHADQLVLERIYPTQWIAPELYKTADKLKIDLGAYETAIFKVHPISKATKPLISNVIFEEKVNDENNCELTLLRKTGDIQVLNPEFVKKIKLNDKELDIKNLVLDMPEEKEFIDEVQLTSQQSMGNESINNLKYKLKSNNREAAIAILLTPEEGSNTVEIPKLKVFNGTEAITVKLNGSKITEKTKFPVGEKVWYTFPIPKGGNELKLIIEGTPWKGNMDVYSMTKQKMEVIQLSIETNKEISIHTMPPKPWNQHEIGKVENVISKSLTLE